MQGQQAGSRGAAVSRPRQPSDRARRHHVGADRRAAPRPESRPDLRILGLTIAALATLWVILTVAALTDRRILDDVDWSTLTHLFGTATVSIAGVVAFLAFMRRRLVGTTEPVYLGSAALLLGVLVVAIAQLLPDRSTATEIALVEGLEPSVRLVAALVLLAAAATAEIDTRVSFPRVFGSALALIAISATVFSVIEPAGTAMASSAGDLAVTLAWAAVAVAHVVVGRRDQRRGNWIIAATAVALLFAGLASVVTSADAPSTVATSTFFELFAFLILLGQGLRDLEWSFCEQRARLFDTEVAVRAVTTLRRADHEVLEERAHDAKSALLAIEAAATALERHRDQVDADIRGQLGEAMTVEVARLHRLIAADGHDDACAPYSLAEVLAPIVATERVRGTTIDLRVPGALVSRGRWADTAEVFRNLFDNARRYAPGSPLAISAEVDGDWVLVHVDDRGPGVERTERTRIFERGDRGSSSRGTNGDGLGLFVSRRLVREQGGDLWAEPRPGGGARFAFCLPLDSCPHESAADSAPAEPSFAGLHSGGTDG